MSVTTTSDYYSGGKKKDTLVCIHSYVNSSKDREWEKNFKITDKKVTFLPGVETPVDHSDVAIGQQGIVGRHTTGERAEDGRIAFNFVPEAKILEISKSKFATG